jgi:CRP/FNR family cyclic AMP-dependent transcriptional regulator
MYDCLRSLFAREGFVPSIVERSQQLGHGVEASKIPGKPEIAERAIYYREKEIIFNQGSLAEKVFYIERGRVKLSVISKQGKEAVIAIMPPGSFFGEGSLSGQTVNFATASAFVECTVFAFDKRELLSAIRKNPDLAEFFITYLLERNARIEEDLVDHLFNSSEKRLARLLLLLAHVGKDDQPEVVRVSQETLARMIGTTRSRVSFFMNKFRRLGLIEYKKEVRVHPSLRTMVLRD